MCFSLSVYVLSRGIANKLHLSYSVLTMAISCWSITYLVARILDWRAFETAHILLTLALGPLSLLFLNVLLRPEGNIFKWIMRVALANSLLLTVPVILGWDENFIIRVLSFYSPSLIIVANLYLLVSEAQSSARPRGGWGDFAKLSSLEMRQALKRRNLWLYLGGVIFTMLCTLDRSPWMGRTLPSVGNFLLALYFYFIKDAVLLQAMLSPRRILGRFFSTLIASGVVYLIFAMSTAWVKSNNTMYVINALFASVVITFSLDPLRSLTNQFFQKFFFVEGARIQKLIQESTKEMAGAFHVQAIAASTEKFLGAALSGKITSFYVLDAEGKRFRKIQDGTDEQKLPDFLPASYPLVQHWIKAKTWMPALEGELETESLRESFPSRVAMIQLALESLHALQSTLAFPLVHEKVVLGFATMNLKEPPESWQESWGALPLLAPYFERAGEALRELDVYARLRVRDRMATIGEMATGLAHEIRNPLGAIKGAAQVMDPKPGDPNEPFLKIIVEETNRLNGVVTRFLEYAKPFQGEPIFADLGVLVSNVAHRYLATLADKKILLDLQVPRLFPKIRCQPDLIELVLINLIENSTKALSGAAGTKVGAPNIAVRLSSVFRDNLVEVSLSVEDNGPGMTPEVLDKIFIPFFTQSPQGTGLGLSICQKIAETHGGRMEASSIPGEGTQMVLTFTAEKEDSYVFKG